MTPVSGRPGHMDGTPMTTFTRKGWQSHGSHTGNTQTIHTQPANTRIEYG